MSETEHSARRRGSLLMSRRENVLQVAGERLGRAMLLLVTSLSLFAVLFILLFIARDAIPFFTDGARAREFFTSTHWYPSNARPEFGALAIFFGSALVTLGAAVVAVPLGVTAAVALSDVLPFNVRQAVKPMIEVLTAIPSVAYGFFALVVFAPLLQTRGASLLGVAVWVVVAPPLLLGAFVMSDLLTDRAPERLQARARVGVFILLAGIALAIVHALAARVGGLAIPSGANAINVAIILGIMALPTVISVSEDALQAVGRDLREGSYALGATRAETMFRCVIPAASSGILAAVILGVMRAIGETMVVWMASGNAAQIPKPWYNFLTPVRTLTATIAGDMGEADQVTGSARYHVLFAMALCLLVFSFGLNLLSEWVVARQRRRLGK